MQSIKAATEDGLCGDRISAELLVAADDLYHLRIPSKWSQLGGDTSPPPTWSLAAWFTDLANRFSHIDRIIVQVTKHVDTVSIVNTRERAVGDPSVIEIQMANIFNLRTDL